MGIKAGDGRGRIATSLRSFVPADQRKPTRDVLEFKGSSCATASERLTSDPLLPARSRAPEKTNTSAIDLYRKSKQSFTIPNLAKTKTRTRKTTNTSNVFIFVLLFQMMEWKTREVVSLERSIMGLVFPLVLVSRSASPATCCVFSA